MQLVTHWQSRRIKLFDSRPVGIWPWFATICAVSAVTWANRGKDHGLPKALLLDLLDLAGVTRAATMTVDEPDVLRHLSLHLIEPTRTTERRGQLRSSSPNLHHRFRWLMVGRMACPTAPAAWFVHFAPPSVTLAARAEAAWCRSIGRVSPAHRTFNWSWCIAAPDEQLDSIGPGRPETPRLGSHSALTQRTLLTQLP